MLYSPPTKGDDGLYFVKALNDTKRKCMVQLNKVKVSEITGEVVFDLVSEANADKLKVVDAGNLIAAHENASSWFGKALSEKVVEGAYTPTISNDQITGDRIDATKVFNSAQENIDFDTVKLGKTCDVILEFSGLWFAKKAFGSSWNIVQVRVHDDPILDTYPDEYAFVDDDDQ
jgi:hypothetical protein|tara:strand:- start:1307 stop:1828 length:522 start_codon:yes stop_codon:yes gene_type:complete